MSSLSRKAAAPSILALAALVTAVACSTTQPVATQLDDAAITAQVNGKIVADPETNPFEIGVDVSEGVVRLSGYVDEPGDRAVAEELARSVDGVERVINDIRIGEMDAGRKLSDDAISIKVKAKIAADPDLLPNNVDVDTQDGLVTLMGRVETAEDRARVEQLARDTDGVRDVQNLLEVGDLQQDAERRR